MRIVSGIYGGRRLQAPEGRDVRPTSDKVRGAIFNVLLSRIDVQGVRVLDVFCGSGALGLEALSRGAGYCTFIDSSRTSLALARDNAQLLGVEEMEFIRSDAATLRACSGEPADLVFLDPPYDKDLALPALQALVDGGWLENGAVCVLEVEQRFFGVFPAMFEVVQEKSYGTTRILYLVYDA